MTNKPITREAFTALCNVFFNTLDDDNLSERYCSDRDIAVEVFDWLGAFLFKAEVEKEARHQQWLGLCEEFGNNPGESK